MTREHAVRSRALEPAHRGEKPGEPRTVVGARFETVGQLFGLIRLIRTTSGSPFAQRSEIHPIANPQHSRALRPHQRLVAGKREEIDGARFDVDGNPSDGLRRVEQKSNAPCTRGSTDGFGGGDGSRDVRRVRHHDETRRRTERGDDVVRVNHAVVARRNARRRDDAVGFEPMQRTQHRVVVVGGGDDVVPRTDESLDREIQRVGSVEREDHPFGRRGADEPSEGRPQLSEHPTRFDRFPVAAASGARGEFAVVVHHRVEHLLGLRMGRGCVVEIKRHGIHTTRTRRKAVAA